MIGPKPEKPAPGAEARARKLVTARDEGLCVRCRRAHLGVNFDHRKNRSQGGEWSASNGQLLCGSGTTGCHGEVTAYPAMAVAGGWAVPGWPEAVPSEWPARRWVPGVAGILHRVWVLYDDQGGWTEISDAEAARRMVGVP
jgi:hypothetical protein